MCTLTWIGSAGRWEIFFNRDEQRTRPPGLAPALEQRAGVSWLAPRDPLGGGTWISVNHHGLVLALMNGAQEPKPSSQRSRGLLVDALASCGSMQEVRRHLSDGPLECYAPFVLVIFDSGELPLSASWNGLGLDLRHVAEADLPLSSSSTDPEGARLARRRTFLDSLARNRKLDTDFLTDFHASHSPEPSARSTCMHREDAQTVSFTRVRVRADVVEMGHSAGPLCAGAPLEWSCLARARVSAGAARS